jgi:hypothetical protein
MQKLKLRVKLLTPDGNGHASMRPIVMTGHAKGAHVTHNARHDGTGCHDRLMTPTHGTSIKQSHDVEPSPSPSASQRGDVSIITYKTNRAHLQEKKYDAALGHPSS